MAASALPPSGQDPHTLANGQCARAHPALHGLTHPCSGAGTLPAPYQVPRGMDPRALGPPAPPGPGSPFPLCDTPRRPSWGELFLWALRPPRLAQGQTITGLSRGRQQAAPPHVSQCGRKAPSLTGFGWGSPESGRLPGRTLATALSSLLSPAWGQAARVRLLSLGAGPLRLVQSGELAAGCVSGHRVPFLGPVWLSPEDLPAAPSLPLRWGRTPYLPASEATLVAGGHLLALKPSAPA